MNVALTRRCPRSFPTAARSTWRVEFRSLRNVRKRIFLIDSLNVSAVTGENRYIEESVYLAKSIAVFGWFFVPLSNLTNKEFRDRGYVAQANTRSWM
jgi:hypothetical protein